MVEPDSLALDFVQWLGVDMPRWIQNELRHAEDTIYASIGLATWLRDSCAASRAPPQLGGAGGIIRTRCANGLKSSVLAVMSAAPWRWA